MILKTPTYVSLDATSVDGEPKNINSKPMEKEHIIKKRNDLNVLQTDIPSDQQSIKSNSNSQDKSYIPVIEKEEEEVQKTFQRRPQFRYNENNRRRFY